MFVAAGDVNGDGKADIIVAPDSGAPPIVRVFDGNTSNAIRTFFAYSPFFLGGVHVAAGDVNGDGRADIITGAAPGGGPHVKIFDGTNLNLLQSFFAYDPAFLGGVFVGAGDVNGDGRVDIITGAGPGGAPHVKVFDSQNLALLQASLPTSLISWEGFSSLACRAVRDSAGEWLLSVASGPLCVD